MTRPRLGWRKKIAFVVLSLFLGGIVAAGLGEAVCRVCQGDRYLYFTVHYFSPGSVKYDPDIGWAYRPGYEDRWRFIEYDVEVKINSLGLRDREYGEKTRPRVLFVGDSFVFGAGVDLDQTFVKQTERRLAADGVAVECINGGRIASGTDVYLHYVRKYAPILKPDIVAVCVHPESDFDETWSLHSGEAARYREVKGEVYRGDEPLAAARGYHPGPLFSRSALYRFVRVWVWRYSIRKDSDPFRARWLQVCLKKDPPWLEAGKRWVFYNLSEIQRYCRERDIRMVLVLVPSDFDLQDRLWRRTLTRWSRDAGDYDRDKPFRLLLDYAGKSGIPALDLRAPLRGERKRLYYAVDRHFNPAGNAAAGRAIAAFLKEQGLVGAAGGKE